MKIRMIVDEAVIKASLVDNAAAHGFAAFLPFEVELKDFNSTEKVGNLPGKLSTEGLPNGMDPDVGDITYYAPWGTLAIFYRDFGYADGLMPLGKIETGIEALQNAKSFKMRIEADD